MNDDETIKRLDHDILERQRLRALSNEDLVRECLSYPSYDDADLHVEELMTRVWPGWKDQ